MNNVFISQFFDWDHRMPKEKYEFINKLLQKLGFSAQLVPIQPCMANIEARMNIFHLVSQVLAYKVPGDIVEIGCNAGESSIVIQQILRELGEGKEFHVFDSFEGLPELNIKDDDDGVYKKGSMSTSLKTLENNFSEVNLPLPHIHKGWFEDTVPQKLPKTLSFALVDGDLYTSTKHVLPYVYQRLSPGGICFFAIYYDETIFSRKNTRKVYKSPGASRAITEFFKDKPESVSILYSGEYSNGYFRKQ